MDQQQPNNTPPVPVAPSKKAGGADILTIIFLVLFPIVGVILMWTITSWAKNTKVLITALVIIVPLLIIGFLMQLVTTSLGGARESAYDARRNAEVRQIATAQELYLNKNGEYYRSAKYPNSIPGFLEQLPTDPSFGWVDNTQNREKFCVYAELAQGGYFISSHVVRGEVAQQPLTLSDCENI